MLVFAAASVQKANLELPHVHSANNPGTNPCFESGSSGYIALPTTDEVTPYLFVDERPRLLRSIVPRDRACPAEPRFTSASSIYAAVRGFRELRGFRLFLTFPLFVLRELRADG